MNVVAVFCLLPFAWKSHEVTKTTFTHPQYQSSGYLHRVTLDERDIDWRNGVRVRAKRNRGVYLSLSCGIWIGDRAIMATFIFHFPLYQQISAFSCDSVIDYSSSKVAMNVRLIYGHALYSNQARYSYSNPLMFIPLGDMSKRRAELWRYGEGDETCEGGWTSETGYHD